MDREEYRIPHGTYDVQSNNIVDMQPVLCGHRARARETRHIIYTMLLGPSST